MEHKRVTGIKSVAIENFQSHENTVLDFSDGLNVIVGPSDQGKSAVIRAIKWVLYNEPRGMDFIRQGTAYARVTLKMTNEYKIVRERSKSKNRYTVINPEGEEEIFEGFGNGIPQEVIDAHGIPKVMLDTDISSSLNIGDQLEGPFLLSETGAVRAKAIGRLTGIHVIDNAIRDSITDLRRENQSNDRLGKELRGIDSKLDEYKALDDIKEKLEVSSRIIVQLEQENEKLERLVSLASNLEAADNEYKDVKGRLEKLKNLNQCEDILKICSGQIQNLKITARLDGGYKSITVQLDRALIVLVKTNGCESCSNILKGLEVLDKKYNKLSSLKIKYDEIREEREKADEILKKTKEAGKSAERTKIIEESIRRYGLLVSIDEKSRQCYKEIRRAILNIKRYQNLDKCAEVSELLDKKLDMLDRLCEARDQYGTINNSISDGINCLEDNRIQTINLSNEYTGLLKKAGRCPTCGSDISELKINEIAKHYQEEL